MVIHWQEGISFIVALRQDRHKLILPLVSVYFRRDDLRFGAYTAGAVSSFAYERRAPLVDTNVARLLLRMFAPRFAPKSALGQQVAWALAEATLPRSGRNAWTHNQALIELGALVCTARIAHCSRCPQAPDCVYAEERRSSGNDE